VEVWTRRLAWPGAVALIARLEGQPAGSVMAHPDPESGGGQLAGLHVLPAHWGQGIGSALHDAALTLLAGAGHRTAALWVLAPNIRARRMYERRGWQLGAETQAGPHGVPEIRYYRDLP
jgi:GNAT superfamily N-acetyltransferase